MKILLKAEHELPSHREGKTFHELDSRRSLRWNIRRKTIVEYPVLYAVLSHHSDYFGEHRWMIFFIPIRLIEFIQSLVYEEPSESQDLVSLAMSSEDSPSAVDSKKRKIENDDLGDDDDDGAGGASFGLLASEDAGESDEDSVTAGERKRRAREEEANARGGFSFVLKHKECFHCVLPTDQEKRGKRWSSGGWPDTRSGGEAPKESSKTTSSSTGLLSSVNASAC